MSKKHSKDPLFYRSFHLTAGGLFLLLPVWIWVAQGDRSGDWPLFAWLLYFCLPIIGVGFLAFGIIASDQKIASIRIAATDSGIVMAILAFPLYSILRAIKRKKHARSLHRGRNHVA
jgi:hypothetical protein